MLCGLEGEKSKETLEGVCHKGSDSFSDGESSRLCIQDWRVKLQPWVAQEHITPCQWCNQEIPLKRGLLNLELYLLRFLGNLRADVGGKTINIQLYGLMLHCKM